MLTFMRNKLISVHIQDNLILKAYGILDDDMYGIELRISFDISSLKITDIKGKWNRWTTPECHRAIPPLQEAVGWSINDNGFSQKVNKVLGRRSCRHFANLLMECCHSALEAVSMIEPERGEEQGADSVYHVQNEVLSKGEDSKKTIEGAREDRAGTRISSTGRLPDNASGSGLVIDLHVHTSEASPCSSAPIEELIKEARLIGLDGMCLTDHNYNWSSEKIEELRQKHGFLILGGNEITTDQGDMLVFGLDRDIDGIITMEDLRREVDRIDGFIIAAHPFRGFLVVGMNQLGLTPELAMKRPHFGLVDALEVLNSRVSENENAFSLEVAMGLVKTITGGSDAHEVKEVGIYGTRFLSRIENEQGLIDALKNGHCEPVAFRMMKEPKEE